MIRCPYELGLLHQPSREEVSCEDNTCWTERDSENLAFSERTTFWWRAKTHWAGLDRGCPPLRRLRFHLTCDVQGESSF